MFSVAQLTLVATLLSAPPVAPPTPSLNLVVVPIKGALGTNVGPQMKAMVEKPLSKTAKVLPYRSYQKAGKKLKVRPKDASTPTGATTIARSLGLTHVLLVESYGEKLGGKKSKPSQQLKASVVDVKSGDVVFVSAYAIKGKKLSKDIAAQMVADVSKKLTEPPPEAAPAPVPPSPDAPPPPPEIAATPAAAAVVVPPPPDAPPPPPEVAAATEEVAAPVAEPAAVVVAPSDSQESSAPVVAAAVESSPAPAASTDKDPAWRPALMVRLGGYGFLRRATVSDKSEEELTYGGDPFPSGMLQLEFYPMALGGNGKIVEGLGVFGEAIGTQAKTLVNAESGETVSSTVLSLTGGLSLRFVLGGSNTSPELRLQGGYTQFTFPLPAGVYPGATLSGLWAGGSLLWPFVESFALVLGGGYAPTLGVAGKAEKLGKVDTATAWMGEGGFRFGLGMLDFGFMGRVTSYDATFAGDSSLPDVRTFSNATMKDKHLAGYLNVGVKL